MGTASHGVVMDYDMSQPGQSIPDEAKRATADLARRASMWVTIAEVNEELLNPTIAIDYDDDTGEELPIQRPPVNIRPNSRREDFEREVSEFWPVWIKAWQRAQDALKTITFPEIMGPLLAARQAMVELGRIFNPQVSPAPDHRLGHHLSRPGGVLYCRAGGRCTLRRVQVEAIVRPLEEFSDLVGTYVTSPTPARTPSREPTTGWTVTRLVEHLKTSESTASNWRKAAEPKVPPRKGKGDTFDFDEIKRLADGATKLGHTKQALKLRAIAEGRIVAKARMATRKPT